MSVRSVKMTDRSTASDEEQEYLTDDNSGSGEMDDEEEEDEEHSEDEGAHRDSTDCRPGCSRTQEGEQGFRILEVSYLKKLQVRGHFSVWPGFQAAHSQRTDVPPTSLQEEATDYIISVLGLSSKSQAAQLLILYRRVYCFPSVGWPGAVGAASLGPSAAFGAHPSPWAPMVLQVGQGGTSLCSC
jgi:hypothetical protein